MTEDKHPVKSYIEQVAADRDHHRHKGVSEPFEELPREAEKQEGHDRYNYQYIVRTRAGDDFGLLTESVQVRDTRG